MADDFESGSRSVVANGNTTIAPFLIEARIDGNLPSAG
jgi:hypothetical protein